MSAWPAVRSACAGDINGDGFDDLLVGGHGRFYYSSQTYDVSGTSGRAYIIFGKAGRFDAEISLDNLNGNDGFTFFPQSSRYDYITSVSSTGDINGDGFDDAVLTDNTISFVVFGKTDGFQASISEYSLDGTNGFVIDNVGNSVTGNKDVNGDGLSGPGFHRKPYVYRHLRQNNRLQRRNRCEHA
ncbi:MAG: FG-GAP repeat protein [Phycisphaerales bacterium]